MSKAAATLMTHVSWNDAAGRAHALALGGVSHEPGTHQCTALCVRALAAERPACTLVSDALQLTVRMRVVDVLQAEADACEVLTLRRADVPEPVASHAANSLYVLVMRAYDRRYLPFGASGLQPRVAWGCGPNMLVNCLWPADTRVPDIFPLSQRRRHAMRALRNVVAELQATPRLVSKEEVEAAFGDSWLDCEHVDARAMPGAPPGRRENEH
jgi:hypothetical protein